MHFADIVRHVRIADPAKFQLADHDPADCCGLDIGKDEAKSMLTDGIKRLTELQEKLYAEDRWAVLVILQGMDASGKDSTIKHVMSGVNPQGCEVYPFKAPSAQELDHDFLWRAACRLPERGRIGIFNRSYYEELLVVRVHPELLEKERLPDSLAGKSLWQDRFTAVRNFEQTLTQNGTLILKFFLNVSKEEQRQRFLARLDEPGKRWKFSMGDVAERALWDDYMHAYEDMIRNTSTDQAPWHVIASDNKWFTQLAVASTLVHTLDGLKIEYPQVKGKALKELHKARKALSAEKESTRSKE